MKLKKVLKVSLIVELFFTLCTMAYSRAGGGGGGGFSGGGSSSFSSSSSSFSGGGSGEGGVGFLFFIFIILFFIFINKNKGGTLSQYNQYDPNNSKLKRRNKTPGRINFKVRNPEFNSTKFYTKVEKSFKEIQEAWEKQDLSEVRRYISDGVYQRFNVQFNMMKELDQKNIISQLNVLDLSIDRYEEDGDFDIIHVGILASINDSYKSKKYPYLNQGGYEKFIEYWSFIRKKGSEEYDLYESSNCPKCGAALAKDGGEVSKCEQCGVYTNRGEYDWVLSEITQIDDYISESSKSKLVKSDLENLIKSNDDFSVQLLEDKASNGFLQILTAEALKKPELMRRFISDNLYNELSNKKDYDKYFYNRLYLNSVDLINISEKDNKDILSVKIKYSFERVRIKNGRANKLDNFMNSKSKIITLERDKNVELAKGDLYSHSCPSCGGALGDTTDINCPFCDSLLTSTKYEWIITEIMSFNKYAQKKSAVAMNQGVVERSILNNLKDNNKLNDMILHNVLIVLYADKKLTSEERDFAISTAKKLGFNPKKLKTLSELAAHGRLALKIPVTEKDKNIVLEKMKKAMMVDGVVSKEEEAMIKEIESSYNN